MTGQNDRQTKVLSGQIVILAGHSPVTGRYFEPCYEPIENLPIDTKARGVVSLSLYCFVSRGNDWHDGRLIQSLEKKAFPFSPTLCFARAKISCRTDTTDNKRNSPLRILLFLSRNLSLKGSCCY